MEAVCSSETYVNLYRTTRRYIQENNTKDKDKKVIHFEVALEGLDMQLAWKEIRTHKLSAGSLKKRVPLGRPRHKWEYHIAIYLN
jgi:hypothetical protein